MGAVAVPHQRLLGSRDSTLVDPFLYRPRPHADGAHLGFRDPEESSSVGARGAGQTPASQGPPDSPAPQRGE